MFIDHSVALEEPAMRVAGDLIASAARWQGLGAAAYRKGEEMRSRVGPRSGPSGSGSLGAPRPLAKEVVIALGHAEMGRSVVTVPVTWRATGAAALFPRLEGEIEVTPLAPARTQLRFRGSYRPPFGALGNAVDRLLMARFARATVVDWVDAVARQIAADLSDQSPPDDVPDVGV